MYITFGFDVSIAIELTERVGYPVLTRLHAFVPSPPVVDFQSPPLAEPAQTIFGVFGLTAIASIRPPTLFGPSDRQLDASEGLENLSSLFIVLLTYRAAFSNAPRGMKSKGSARCAYHQ